MNILAENTQIHTHSHTHIIAFYAVHIHLYGVRPQNVFTNSASIIFITIENKTARTFAILVLIAVYCSFQFESPIIFFRFSFDVYTVYSIFPHTHTLVSLSLSHLISFCQKQISSKIHTHTHIFYFVLVHCLHGLFVCLFLFIISANSATSHSNACLYKEYVN